MFAGVRGDADGTALKARTSATLRRSASTSPTRRRSRGQWHIVASSVGERGLFGLVNNAGIVKPGPLEFQPIADFRRQLEVNLIGQVAVT